MVVVFGDKKTKVGYGHWLSQTRMERGAGEAGGSHPTKPGDDSAPGGAKAREQVGDGAIVMGGFVRFAILEIGRVQFGGAGVVIIQPQVPQRFQIEKVTDIFLDRPLPFGFSR